MKARCCAGLLLLIACGDDAAREDETPGPAAESVGDTRASVDASPRGDLDASLRMLDGRGATPATHEDAAPVVAASDAAPAPESFPVCPLENACPYATYPCVPSDDGAGFSCRGQYAAWPMPDADPQAKYAPSYRVDAARDVVLDQITGLLWQRSLPKSYAGCTGTVAAAVGDSCSLDEARAYCDRLTLAGERWRLPSRIELESLLRVDDSHPGKPFIDLDAFPNTPLDFFWSNSPVMLSAFPNRHYSLGFGSAVAAIPPPTVSQRVRCVHSTRNPNAPPQARTTIDAQARTMVDALTGLRWDFRFASTLTPSVERARERCASLAGIYRLPSYKELLTLADVVNADRAIAVALWPVNNNAMSVWSSSQTVLTPIGYAPAIGMGFLPSDFPAEVSTLCVR